MFANLASVPETATKKSRKWLWIFILILVVLLLLAIFVLPRYQQHLKKVRSAAAREAVETLKGRVEDWWKTNGSMGGFSVETAIKESELSNKVKAHWNLFVAWKPTEIYTREMVDKLKNIQTTDYVYVAPFKAIMAVATPDNPLPEGTKVWLEGDSNTYHGYGIDDRIEPDWKVIFPNP